MGIRITSFTDVKRQFIYKHVCTGFIDLHIQYSYQRYRAYVLATDAPSCPKSLVGPRWVPGGSQVGPWWVPGGSRWTHKDREILQNVKWKIDTVPKSEKSSPWAPAARIFNDIR